MECGITNKRKSDNVVGKKFTDELLIKHRRNISVDKTVKSCSELSSECLQNISIKLVVTSRPLTNRLIIVGL